MSKVRFKPVSEFSQTADKVFKEQRTRISQLLPYADIQHVGSTSIPGSITKGDVDIAVRVPADKFDIAVKTLKSLYEINQRRNWTRNFASFKSNLRGMGFGAQLVIKGSAYDDFVSFSRALASNPKLLKAYNELKIKYEGKNMSSYRKAKSEFFQQLREKLYDSENVS